MHVVGWGMAVVRWVTARSRSKRATQYEQRPSSTASHLLVVVGVITGVLTTMHLLGWVNVHGLYLRYYGMKVVLAGARCRNLTPQHYLSMMTVFKNMKPYIKEWIEFHQMVGFEHFYLYDNNSTDAPGEELKQYVAAGIVSVHFLKNYIEVAYNGKRENFSQQRAVADVILRSRCRTKWLAILDMDEFLFSPRGISIPAALKPYEPYGGVALAWLLFGTSNNTLPPDRPTVEGFTRRMKEPVSNWKNIVQPKRLAGLYTVHQPIYTDGYSAVDEQFRPVYTDTNANIKRTYSVFRVHHYFTRSHLDWYLRVYERGSVAGPVKRYTMHDLCKYHKANEFVDTSITPLAHELQRRLSWNGTQWRQRFFPKYFGGQRPHDRSDDSFAKLNPQCHLTTP